MAVDRKAVNRFLAESNLPAAVCRTLDVLAKTDAPLALEQAKHEKTPVTRLNNLLGTYS